MNETLFTLGDVIQIALMLAACYACYVKGELKGIEETVTELIDRGLLDEKELEEMMKEEP